MSPSKGRSGLLPSKIGIAAAPLIGLVSLCGTVAQAQTTSVGDRYSSEIYVGPAGAEAAPSSGPMLSWPGKTSAAPPPATPATYPRTSYQAQAPQPSIYQTPAYQTPAYQTPAQPTPQPSAYAAPPVMPWYQRYSVAAPSSSPLSGAPASATPAPQSIYDPPASSASAAASASSSAPSPAAMAPPTSQTASVAGEGETARFYSVHRQYGLTPDPDPIPPQFFSQTADLSDPPGPSPIYKATSASGASATAVHPVQSEDGASSLSQP